MGHCKEQTLNVEMVYKAGIPCFPYRFLLRDHRLAVLSCHLCYLCPWNYWGWNFSDTRVFWPFLGAFGTAFKREIRFGPSWRAWNHRGRRMLSFRVREALSAHSHHPRQQRTEYTLRTFKVERPHCFCTPCFITFSQAPRVHLQASGQGSSPVTTGCKWGPAGTGAGTAVPPASAVAAQLLEERPWA